MSSWNNDRVLYVGNLPGDIREREIEDLFYKYGRIVIIDLKIPARSPCYAFIEFDDADDAQDAIRGRNGYNFDGNRLQVELAHGRRESSFYDSHCDSSGGAPRGIGMLRHTSYRVEVTGLPSSASWQDLKDYMRPAGDVCLSEVYHDGEATTGIVDFTNYNDMKYAIERFDGSEFKNASSRVYIRVKEYDPKRSSSRSRNRSNSRSPCHCHERSLSRRSRSRSRSPINADGKDKNKPA